MNAKPRGVPWCFCRNKQGDNTNKSEDEDASRHKEADGRGTNKERGAEGVGAAIGQ